MTLKGGQALSRAAPGEPFIPPAPQKQVQRSDDHHALSFKLSFNRKRYDGLYSSTHIHHFDPEVSRTNTVVVVVLKQTFLNLIESLHLVHSAPHRWPPPVWRPRSVQTQQTVRRHRGIGCCPRWRQLGCPPLVSVPATLVYFYLIQTNNYHHSNQFGLPRDQRRWQSRTFILTRSSKWN